MTHELALRRLVNLNSRLRPFGFSLWSQRKTNPKSEMTQCLVSNIGVGSNDDLYLLLSFLLVKFKTSIRPSLQ